MPSYRRLRHGDRKVSRFNDRMDCKECGGSYIYLLGHICQIHGLSDYKKKFGIKDNKELYGKDYLKFIQESAAEIGVSEEAVEARTKYWSKDYNLKNKAKWMKGEMKERMKNPEFAKKWENRASIQKFKERALERKRIAKKPRNCIVCGKTFIPKTVFWGGHDQTNTKRRTCSNKCQKIVLSGRSFTTAHRLNLALSKAKETGYVVVGTTVRYKRKCVVCGKEMLVPLYKVRGKYEKKVCGHACSGVLAGRVVSKLSKDPKWIKKRSESFKKWRRGEYKKCKVCNKVFYTHPSTKDQVYCSHNCWSKSNRTIKHCKVCGVEFEVRNSEVNKIQKCVEHRR